ncbi:MAG: M56 family metallopeptidase [Candidatus Acidiferrum sp.]
MHEHIARAMYYVSVHLVFASIVASTVWALTSLLRASATTEYWIWVATAFNFVLPSGALIDKLCAPHLAWARPLGVIGGPVWDLTQGRIAVILGVIWMSGGFSMLMRLISRIRKERGEAKAQDGPNIRGDACNFVTDGIPVSFDDSHPSPAVRGVFFPRILLPTGIDRLLSPREFRAVLIHEVTHARRHDNLIRLLYEFSLCVLWFHPFVWLAGARIALYRELSCDESVVRRSHGPALVSALAKLAVCEQSVVLQATASSHLSYRLARLSGPAQTTCRAASLLLTSLFAIVSAAAIFQTVAHTACCFVLKR